MTIHPGQFRLSRIQLINWGTFEGSLDIPVSRDGFLITGGSGSGKSTLIDAITAVLLPGDRVRFNAAAQANTPRGKGRNLVSYVRGAWRSREDHASGQVVATYLRPRATYSVVGLTYDNAEGTQYTLVAVFYLKSGHNSPADVDRLYGLFPGQFPVYDLVEHLGSGIDKRRIKATHSQASFSEKHSVFAAKFRTRLGIASEEALHLLHRAQSAKDLQSLDDLFRDYMLVEPKTFGMAEQAVEQFRDLEGAYERVEDIRAQVAMLEPLVGLAKRKDAASTSKDYAHRLKGALPTVGNRIKREEQTTALRRHTIELAEAEAQLDTARQALAHAAEMEKIAQHAVDKTLGDKHGELSARLDSAAKDLGRTREKREELIAAVVGIGGAEPHDADSYAVLGNHARVIVDEYGQRRKDFEERSQQAVADRTRAEDELNTTDRELQALSQGSSNIESRLLNVRRDLCHDLGLSLRDLPFAGELIDPVDPEWEPVVQRQLSGLAATLLVGETVFDRVREWVDTHHLDARLVFNAVHTREHYSSPQLAHNALPRKVDVIESPFRDWLQAELGRRYNYLCVRDAAALAQLRPQDQGVTLQGLVRHARRSGDPTERLEKDDRRRLGDRSTYRLGSTNHGKIELLRQQVKALRASVDAARNRLREVRAQLDALQQEYEAARLILRTTWASVDVDREEQAVADLDQALHDLSDTPEAAELSTRLSAARHGHAQASRAVEEAVKLQAKTDDARRRAEVELARLEALPLPEVDDDTARQLEERLAEATRRIHAGNVDERIAALGRELDAEIDSLEATLRTTDNQIITAISRYVEKWPSEKADLLPQPEYVGEALTRLAVLRDDRLAEFTGKFLELMNELSTRNLGAIARTLRNARREIEDRIDPINRSLARSEFNTGRYLHIDVRDRRAKEVVDFQRDLDSATSGGLSSSDEKQAFARYQSIAKIMGRLSSQDSADQRWRRLVLDTRHHVSFIGLERDGEGQSVNTYVDSSALSGGQAQKLVFFCLAAALRYQLAAPGAQYPAFASIILDEAFDRADPAFTRQTMDVFASFGFHMILATPLKLIQTLGPYVGGTVVVNYSESPDNRGDVRGMSRLSRIERD